MVYPFNGNLNNKKARTTDWCLNISKPKIHFSKENGWNPQGYMLYNFIHMKFYEKLTVVMGNRWAFARDSREVGVDYRVAADSEGMVLYADCGGGHRTLHLSQP